MAGLRVDRLTAEQLARIPEWIQRWTQVGLSTEVADRPAAEEGIRLAYRVAGLPAPRIVWCTSPLANALTRASVRDSGWEIGASVGTSLWATVWDSVMSSVLDSVGASVRDSGWEIGASVGTSVWTSVRDSVGASVRDSGREIGASVGVSVGASVWESGYGQHDAHWIALGDFFRGVCGLTEETEQIMGLRALCLSAGWYLPHERICWVSERHSRLRRDTAGKLHDERGMALQYPDGWGIYALHGVRVPGALVETTAADLDVRQWVQAERNAEIRREAVRKIGIERVCQALGATVLDRRGDYELLALDVGDGRMRPYLKMRNPSLGVWHVEGVHPSCRTVRQAINWRAGDDREDWQPDILT